MIRDDWNDRLPASGWDTGREAITLAQAEVAVFRTVFGTGLELGGGGVPRVRAGRVARDCSARSSARCGRCASSCGRPWLVTRCRFPGRARCLGSVATGAWRLAYDDGEVRQQFSICLACTIVSGTLQVSSESTAVDFFAVADLPNLQMHESIRVRIRDYLDNKSPVLA